MRLDESAPVPDLPRVVEVTEQNITIQGISGAIAASLGVPFELVVGYHLKSQGGGKRIYSVRLKGDPPLRPEVTLTNEELAGGIGDAIARKLGIGPAEITGYTQVSQGEKGRTYSVRLQEKSENS